MAALAQKFSIELEGLKHIVTELTDSEVYREPWQQGMDALGKVAQQFAIQAAPLFKGPTIAKMAYRVQNKPIPLYVVVKTTAKNPKSGYGYPRLLEYTTKWRHLGWMVNAIKNSRSVWGGVLDGVATKIAAKWSS